MRVERSTPKEGAGSALFAVLSAAALIPAVFLLGRRDIDLYWLLAPVLLYLAFLAKNAYRTWHDPVVYSLTEDELRVHTSKKLFVWSGDISFARDRIETIRAVMLNNQCAVLSIEISPETGSQPEGFSEPMRYEDAAEVSRLLREKLWPALNSELR